MIEMTNEEILQLAEQHFDYQGGWIAYIKEDLLKFALAIHENGYNKGYEECSFDMGDENV
jgi:hypothetical protein